MTIVCEPCGRRAQYDVERLEQQLAGTQSSLTYLERL
jgi:hypothetical protein